MTSMTDTSADSPTDAVGPIISMTASIDAPAIQAQQDAFRTENPNLFVMTVADYNEALKAVINKTQEKLREDGDIPASTARYEYNVSYVTNDGIALAIAVHCAGFEDADVVGSELVSGLIELTDTMTRHLVTDPLSKHRRKHVAELMEGERKKNQDNPDFDEAAVMDAYNHARLGALCAMSLADKALPSILAVAGFYPDSDNPFGGPYDDQPRRTFWGQVKDFFTN